MANSDGTSYLLWAVLCSSPYLQWKETSTKPMNVKRFAGDNTIMQKLAADLQQGEALMRRRQSEAMQNAYEQRARDVAATGVKNSGLFL